MDRLEAMRVFVTVLDEGSLSAAGRALRRSPAAITRAVAALERYLGAPLLARTTRAMRLTKAGELYATNCRRILAELADAEALVAGGRETPHGVLTLSAPPVSGQDILRPILDSFLKAHPGVSARLLLLDRPVNLVDEGVDVAMRVGDLPDSTLVAVKVGADVRRVVVGAPRYLATAPPIATPGDLAGHQIVAMDNFGVDRWVFPAGAGSPGARTVTFAPRILVNSVPAAIASSIAGLGLTRVYSYHAAEAVRRGELAIVLADDEPAPLPVHLIVQPARLPSPRVRAFLDFAAPRLRRAFAALSTGGPAGETA
ncbi:LysR family transcriptional regulator [Phenylobacterium sp.]|uniref:LysR family transcriptional regulator n=1 Tax=Phenylobacterium sp. TaxID=1871053 RepID=UPI00286B5F5B|nr:LysR family transcriptional regulator [Phenylobacterium sp.]